MTHKAQAKKKRPAAKKAVKPIVPEARAAASPTRVAKPAAKPHSKIGKVILLLRRPEGATLAEIVEMTGWQPHTARAALTGLKKKGYRIDRTKRDEATCYRIADVA